MRKKQTETDRSQPGRLRSGRAALVGLGLYRSRQFILYPLLGIQSGKETAPIYVNSTSFLFLGVVVIVSVFLAVGRAVLGI